MQFANNGYISMSKRSELCKGVSIGLWSQIVFARARLLISLDCMKLGIPLLEKKGGKTKNKKKLHISFEVSWILLICEFVFSLLLFIPGGRGRVFWVFSLLLWLGLSIFSASPMMYPIIIIIIIGTQGVCFVPTNFVVFCEKRWESLVFLSCKFD
jgi:hypothetical protein